MVMTNIQTLSHCIHAKEKSLIRFVKQEASSIQVHCIQVIILHLPMKEEKENKNTNDKYIISYSLNIDF